MRVQTRVWLFGLGMMALAFSLYLAGLGQAQEDNEVRDELLKIAAAIQKGDQAAAKSHAKALAQKIETVEDVMNLFRLRTKKGLGVGDTPGAIKPDGIEEKLEKMSEDALSQNAADLEAAALEKMAYVLAAVAEVALAKPPEKKAKLWMGFARDLRAAAPKLAQAAKAKSPPELLKAAAKITLSCNECHTDFK